MKTLLFVALLSMAGTLRCETLTISAAISLKVPLEQICAAFEDSHPGHTIVINFGSSGSLQRQIQYGAPVDVFVSAANRQMDELENGGFLVTGSRRVLAANALVLVASTDIPQPDSLLDMNKAERIAIGEPMSVPVGMYAMQVLERLGIAAEVELIFAKDARQVLTYVERGNVDLGIVYSSDAAESNSFRLVAVIPDGLHDPIEYSAAVVRASEHREVASRFLSFLQSAESKMCFRTAGFITNVKTTAQSLEISGPMP